MNVDQQVKLILSDVSGYDVTDIEDSNTLSVDLELDSMDLLNLGNELEAQLGVEIPDSSVNAGMTVRELVEAIGKLL